MIDQFENYSLEKLDDFDLSKLRDFFIISDFERIIHRSHKSLLKKAIMNNELYDNIITVFKKDNKIKVIDGQHRIGALWELFKEGKLKTYSLILRIIEAEYEEQAIKIYRYINAGKPLTSKDLLKSYDNGTVLFFNALRDYCIHSSGKSSFSYWDILSAFQYTKMNEHKILKYKIKEYVLSVTIEETKKIKEFLKSMLKVVGIKSRTKSNIYLGVVFRPLMRIYFENITDENKEKWDDFLKTIENKKVVKEARGQFNYMYTDEVYDKLLKDFLNNKNNKHSLFR